MQTLQWGTVPDWIGAVSTLLALVGAAVAVFYTHRTNKREEARDDRYEVAQRRAQAELVVVWADQSLGEDDEEIDGFSYRNASQLPVFDVTVYWWSQHWLHRDQVDPHYRRQSRRELGTVAPGTHAFYWMKRRAEVNAEMEDSEDGRGFTLIFRDAADRVWHRDHNGVLHEGAPFWADVQKYDGSH